MCKSQYGFNLLEMMTAVAVAMILATVAVPSAMNTIERRSLSAAAEEILGFARLARTESIKGNRSVFLSVSTDGGNNWCVGLSETAACDCTTAGACQLDGMQRVINGHDFDNINLTQTFADSSTSFDPRRGLAIDSGAMNIASAHHQVEVRISPLGHVRMCSPDGDTAVSGVGPC